MEIESWIEITTKNMSAKSAKSAAADRPRALAIGSASGTNNPLRIPMLATAIQPTV